MYFTDKCDDVTCKNGGTCKLIEEKPVCECAVGYMGSYCEKRKCTFKYKMCNFFIMENLSEIL